MDKAVYFFS